MTGSWLHHLSWQTASSCQQDDSIMAVACYGGEGQALRLQLVTMTEAST